MSQVRRETWGQGSEIGGGEEWKGKGLGSTRGDWRLGWGRFGDRDGRDREDSISVSWGVEEGWGVEGWGGVKVLGTGRPWMGREREGSGRDGGVRVWGEAGVRRSDVGDVGSNGRDGGDEVGLENRRD